MIKKKSYLLHLLLSKFKINFDKKKIKNIIINDVRDLLDSRPYCLSFFSNINYLSFLKNTKASVVLVKKEHINYVPKKITFIISQDPEIDFIKLASFFYPNSYYSKILYDNYDLLEIKKKFKNIKFGLNFYLEKNVKIGKNVFIGNNVTIKNNCKIGNNVIIGSNVVLENSIIFDNVHICDGSIIGKKGFGFKFVDKNQCLRVPHIGKVIIEKNCEIGSNCTIDRGSISNTVIGENTFIDNSVHIAHNVKIGKRCILAAQVGIAGSTIIGDSVVIGGQAGISGHLVIGNNVKIGGKSGVVKNIKDNETVMGYPATSIRQFIKNK